MTGRSLMFFDLSTKQKILVGIFAPIVVLAVLGAVSFATLRTVTITAMWVTHTQEVISSTGHVLLSAVNMETGVRGYLLAGKEKFLEPYDNGTKEAFETIQKLQEKVSDNPKQVQRLGEIERQLRKWQTVAVKPAIALRRQTGITISTDAVSKFVRDAQGKQLFDEFRALVREFQEEEQKLMVSRRAENDSTINNANILILIISVFGLVVAWFFGRMAVREAIQRTAALDSASVNVMIADDDYNIIHLNESMVAAFREAESEIRKVYPSFAVDQLIGVNMDEFHKDQNHQRGLMHNLRSPYKTEIQIGTRIFSLIASPVMDGKKRLGTVVEWSDLTNLRIAEEREYRTTREALIVRAALDVATTNMMVADADYNITYMNGPMVNMFRNAETDIRKQLPSFQVDRLIGANMDEFHVDLKKQRSQMDNLIGTRHSFLEIGGRKFGHTANAIVDEAGSRIGTVIEWEDRTEEVTMESALSSMVGAVAAGNLERRLDQDIGNEFLRGLAGSMNDLSDTIGSVMNDIARSAQSMADGDLSVETDNTYQGIFGEITENTNAAIERLRTTVATITNAAMEVGNASNEMHTGSQDLSHRTEQQAANIEETAASMEEVATTVTQNAQNAEEANRIAATARERANAGGEVVGGAVEAMVRIEESSQKISDILGVIDEIAFQTNLLALNAAVEAARAGDAGKGFAVVASEVGKLALRSSDAAKEIKDLIASSEIEVRNGVKLVSDAGESLSEIVESVGSAAEIIAEISTASREQANSVQEVNASIARMDEMTQQNSALVEQYAASTRALEDQSQFLMESVSFFSLEEAAADEKPQARKAKQKPKPHATSRKKRSGPADDFESEEGWEEF